jgi:hypothetical protein
VSNLADRRAGAGGAGPPSEILKNPDEGFLDKIREAVRQVEDIDEKRIELTASKTAIFAQLNADFAVNKDALRSAMRYVKLKDEAKVNYDLSYEVGRRALGDPVQFDLFDQQLERAVKEDQAKRAKDESARQRDPVAAAQAAFVDPADPDAAPSASRRGKRMPVA